MNKKQLLESKLRKMIRTELLKESSRAPMAHQRIDYAINNFEEVIDSLAEWFSSTSSDLQMDDSEYERILTEVQKRLNQVYALLKKMY